MEWVYGAGLVILVVVVAVIVAAGTPPPRDDADADERPYEWGDELHEYSYRHPWEDE